MTEFLNPWPAPTLQTIYPLVHMRQRAIWNISCTKHSINGLSCNFLGDNTCEPLRIGSEGEFFQHSLSHTPKWLLLIRVLVIYHGSFHTTWKQGRFDICQVLVVQEVYHGIQTLIFLARHGHICNCENLLTFEKLPAPTACRLFCTALPVTTIILHITDKAREPLFLRPASPKITSYPKI